MSYRVVQIQAAGLHLQTFWRIFLLDDQVAEARCLAIGSCRAKLLVSAASSDLHDLEEFFCCSTGQGRVQRCLSKPIAFPIKDSRLLSSCF